MFQFNKEEHQVRYNEIKQLEFENNKFQQEEKMHTRRPRLTLQHLNKLRKMREIRKLEIEERRELYKKIYQRPPPAI